ncbi:uncharacterized protein EV422DRAFT_533614 [Fimicolochytrium jonesii]|uniref:uncharacterized protein n=1 Tax=Fimicolochytrium jonesii TaxID=1396493 RepID=UPI0022FDBBDC|nr:uncharacterized protein EV422DRAFT_533614 [Fimicolochytrium jonesii]KAI8819604.1 hypothetical protein EV422DRAFT_533614 [Fimicolochytrium jonesii]
MLRAGRSMCGGRVGWRGGSGCGSVGWVWGSCGSGRRLRRVKRRMRPFSGWGMVGMWVLCEALECGCWISTLDLSAKQGFYPLTASQTRCRNMAWGESYDGLRTCWCPKDATGGGDVTSQWENERVGRCPDRPTDCNTGEKCALPSRHCPPPSCAVHGPGQLYKAQTKGGQRKTREVRLQNFQNACACVCV